MFAENIESPALEDPQYVEGTPCVLVVTTASGKELSRLSVASFPTPLNLFDIKDESTGVLTIIYNVTLESVTTTDPATGETKVVPGGVEERTIQRLSLIDI